MTDRALIERLRGLLAKATPITGEIRHRDTGDGEERYYLIGSPCGFPVATFGDFNDAHLAMVVRRELPALLESLSPPPVEGVERLKAVENLARSSGQTFIADDIREALSLLGCGK